MDRVCIFIDGSNFYHALKGANLPVRVDLGKLGIKDRERIGGTPIPITTTRRSFVRAETTRSTSTRTGAVVLNARCEQRSSDTARFDLPAHRIGGD